MFEFFAFVAYIFIAMGLFFIWEYFYMRNR
jgi:hypothetical protein